jgi:RNA polymerase sigma-70 factor (sigma-E family)
MSVQAGTFEEYLQESGPGLRRFAYALSGTTANADDLVQEALARCWGRWRRIQAMEHPDSYVRRAVLNLFLSSRRRSLRLPRLRLEPSDVTPDTSDQLADRDQLWRALAGLSQIQRVVLVLRYYEDLPDERIAELVGCAPATVRSHASRALKRLREDPALTYPEGAAR